jgi:hypothetical protein
MIPHFRVIKHTNYSWTGTACQADVKYTLQYRARFFGIPYWADYKEYVHGWDDSSWEIVQERDEQRLIDRFMCSRKKPTIEIV